ncbi:calcium-dependent protein kinase 21 [Stenotrophomonas panacihumi]|uniref:Calcium-dependent protein kinase 21 n=1 Tax=Stenotrophomonas panacihumi TaxID=676599 RepID=A0A0R0ANR0_9GAMM|nr:EF-hand domain-containing protein [Stenotrophomonas panacihumi]KRG46875.1 calcium-dependent protein kinase 21 [Stenotrophomonas panacihumi]PTN56007.1 calcium-dependent protein kinase 21 [Stenotrophomonas panacihumi]
MIDRVLSKLFPERRLVRRSSCWVLGLALLAGSAHAQVTDSGEYLKRMDTDGDGRVSLAEYLAWMSYAFDQRDRNGDGVLSADELPGGRGKPVTREEHIATLTARFKKQDANGDGWLSAKELLAPPR